ncbi:MAG: site-2 protease family protein [Anaerolineales bacterium]|nr:site-2 protease family protein [Anaerolineales bacterium]
MFPPDFSRPPIALENAEALRRVLGDLFVVHDTTLDRPEAGYVRFRGHFLQDPADCFHELRRRFEQFGFTPLLRKDGDQTAVIAMPYVFNPPPSNWVINLVLFLATILTTLFIGTGFEATSVDQMWQLWRGWPFSLSILLILGAHELGHYFAARYHKVPVTLPYFIPVPTILGTMGAFIRLKAPVHNRRALLDVGVAGPLAGMVFAVPILLYGLYTSQIGPVITGGLQEGNSLLYIAFKFLVFGRYLPANGIDVHITSVAFAGWAGLLVTGLNLLPVGQLDGGHVAYVLSGDRAKQLFWPILIALGLLAVLTANTMWVIWIVLLYFLGRTHAQPLDDITTLDQRRWLIAVGTLILFFLVFVPIPLVAN